MAVSGDHVVPQHTGAENEQEVTQLSARSSFATVLTVLSFVVPVVAFFWFIHHYGVNVIYGDQWDDVRLVSHAFAGNLNFHDLWMQHNENRILFPNLIVLALTYTTHLNVVIEEYASGVMLVASAGLFFWIHKRSARSTPWIYYVPALVVMLTLAQHGNILWGFQIAWYLVMLMLGVSLFFLDRSDGRWLFLAAAITAAVVGSYSSVQGLLIWPTGLVLMYHRRRSLFAFIAWVSSAILTTVLYFHNFDPNQGSAYHTYAIRHPIEAIKFYLFALGDIVGVDVGYRQREPLLILVFGALLLAIAVGVLIFYGLRRDRDGRSAIGVALICFGLLFLATITEGRVIFGYWGASASRYTAFDVIVLVGIFLAVLGRPTLFQRSIADVPRWPGPWFGHIATASRGVLVLRTVRTLVLAAMCVQIVLGVKNGIPGARGDYRVRAAAVHVLSTIGRQSNNAVEFFLYPGIPGNKIRPLARVVREHRLSFFADQLPGSAALAGHLSSTWPVSAHPRLHLDGSQLEEPAR
jgi:hypothetical protein